MTEQDDLVAMVEKLHARRTPAERRVAAEEARVQLEAPGIGLEDRIIAETTLGLAARGPS